MDKKLRIRLKQFMEAEAQSGSMDFGCVTPLYVYRMLGGAFLLEDIEMTLPYCKKELEL